MAGLRISVLRIFDSAGLIIVRLCSRWGVAISAGHCRAGGRTESGTFVRSRSRRLVAGWLLRFYGSVDGRAEVATLPPADLAWTVCRLFVELLAESRSSDLRCTVLDMGHGCSVFVEFPNGKILLYDVGTLPSGIRAQRTVEAAIWHRRRSQIDVVIVSHADIDHFNAVPGLMRTVPVGSVIVAQSFLDFQQPAVVILCKTANEENVPIRLVQRGDRLAIDGSAQVRVLLPDGGQRFDNANSIVLLIEYAGRTIQLARDLEGAGLRRLLETPSGNIDVLFAPHHGSLKANPPELVRWANPKWLIVSGHDGRVLPTLQKVYRPTTQTISTHSHGAVTFVIDSRGKLRISAVRRPIPHEIRTTIDET